MDQRTADIQELVRQLPQSAICVRNGVITLCNRMAEARALRPGQAMDDHLSEEDQDAMDEQTAGTIRVTLRLVDGPVPASCTMVGKTQILVLEEAREIYGLRTSLLTNVSNNLRRSLTGLQLAMDELDGEKDEKKIKKAKRNMRRAFHGLLRQCTNLSAAGWDLDEGLVLNRQRIEVLDFVQVLADQATKFCAAAGYTLQCRLPRMPFRGWIDKQRVEQAFYQLLSNAMKFSPKEQPIKLHVRRLSSRLEIRLQDGGAGIDEAVRPTLFRRYDRKAMREDPRSGVGFGLYLARRIAHVHGGSLEVNALPEGGTEMVMLLAMRAPTGDEQAMRTPLAAMDYTGGYNHALVELSEVLPGDVYEQA